MGLVGLPIEPLFGGGQADAAASPERHAGEPAPHERVKVLTGDSPQFRQLGGGNKPVPIVVGMALGVPVRAVVIVRLSGSTAGN